MDKNRKLKYDYADKYISTSQVEIGKNVSSTECRNKIKEYYNKYKKFIPIEIIIIIVISVIVLFLGNI